MHARFVSSIFCIFQKLQFPFLYLKGSHESQMNLYVPP